MVLHFERFVHVSVAFVAQTLAAIGARECRGGVLADATFTGGGHEASNTAAAHSTEGGRR
jgi:hypothetical protein